jgi:hypothetical protein
MTNDEFADMVKEIVKKAQEDAKKPDGPWVVSQSVYNELVDALTRPPALLKEHQRRQTIKRILREAGR